ncbi:hypothetical protein [Clostridium beijerinckii]|uniref:Antirestriction protein n=1 Tax=Clostridium beijerinckii TaxID=1520 RepID=A0AAX0B8D3_CLOBE|nr:hypothetical protein [Clostridium beijerinckii]NRT91483.1 hypothetical protein [Clostridium beijerinckii]NYC71008.1 hypothetical protein [Clostridium beijerinckii]
METIAKNNEMVLGLNNVFKMAKLSSSYADWYKGLKESKTPEIEITNLINVAKENTYNENKIFKAVNVVYDEDKDLVEMYKVPEILCDKNFTHVFTKRSVEFADFTSFIMYTAVECEEDMGFLDAKSYHEGNFDNCQYATNEDAWEALEKLICMDYDEMEKEFKTIGWEDNENTAIVSFKNDDKEYAILRM